MYEQKDLMRIQDIDRKGRTLEGKVSLASHMSKLIKDREKAFRRYEASVQVFGADSAVTEVFRRRWHVLNGLNLMQPEPVAPPTEEVVEIAKAELFGSQTGVDPGESELEDVLKLKAGVLKKGVLEIWETWTREIVHVFRNSETPFAKINAVANFRDENDTFLFGGKMLDWTSAKNTEAAAKKYGSPKEKRTYA